MKSNIENNEQVKPTFDSMPEMLAILSQKVEKLTGLIEKKFSVLQNQVIEDRWLSLDELCDYLPDKPSKATVYGWVNQRIIPYHKTTKRLSFLKSEIDAWIANARRKTAEELREESMRTHGYRKGGAL